jgi:hypothetical protein
MYFMSITSRSDLVWVAEPASHIYLAVFIIDIVLIAVVMFCV